MIKVEAVGFKGKVRFKRYFRVELTEFGGHMDVENENVERTEESIWGEDKVEP